MLSSVFLSKRKLKAKYETKEKILRNGGEYFTDNSETPE